jgi:hypothetical protein
LMVVSFVVCSLSVSSFSSRKESRVLSFTQQTEMDHMISQELILTQLSNAENTGRHFACLRVAKLMLTR